jgi:hypothetical protein
MARSTHVVLGEIEFRAITYSISVKDAVFVVDVKAFDRDGKEIRELSFTITLSDEDFNAFYVNGFTSDADLDTLIVEYVQRKIGDGFWKGFDKVIPDPSYLPDYKSES